MRVCFYVGTTLYPSSGYIDIIRTRTDLLAIGHFIIGYSAILFTAILFRRRTPFVYPLAYLGGLCAMFPDLYQLSYVSVQVKDLVSKLHGSDAANLFFLHRRLDQIYIYDLPDDVSVYLLIGLLLTAMYARKT